MHDILMAAANGGVADKHVEKMFSDLYHGTYENPETYHNFIFYSEQLYNVAVPITSFENDTRILMAYIDQVFNETNYTIRRPDETTIVLKRWNEEFFVKNEKFGIALALAIVHTMRIDIKARFSGVRH